jgi:16S rRNA (cytosine1402-N4)-methyltransferase
MLSECREALALGPGEFFCDCTLGGAGHALGLAANLEPGGLLIGIDQDATALEAARIHLTEAHPSLHLLLLHGNFKDLDDLLVSAEVPGIDGFLFDLGVSSPQIDLPQRGFSYAQDAPLDMRMNPDKQTTTAAELINTTNETELVWILRTYGEERWAARIAHFIVRARAKRPLERTTELVELVKAAIPASARRTGGNPAKRTFQALRIAVNGEMEALRCGLEAALRWLNPGGRVAVLSYHSLEDRIVKEQFAQAMKGCVCLPEAPVCVCGQEPILASMTRTPLRARAEEVESNPRAKSAKLRVAVKRT